MATIQAEQLRKEYLEYLDVTRQVANEDQDPQIMYYRRRIEGAKNEIALLERRWSILCAERESMHINEVRQDLLSFETLAKWRDEKSTGSSSISSASSSAVSAVSAPASADSASSSAVSEAAAAPRTVVSGSSSNGGSSYAYVPDVDSKSRQPSDDNSLEIMPVRRLGQTQHG